MKKIFIGFILSVIALTQYAQETKYDNKEAFYPHFYPYPGNDYRSASGEPGPKYWQNRADYKINATLDTTSHKVTGQVEITYTNNSPDNLKFLWLQLDQNIYKSDSRASATTTQAGGRWANENFTGGYIIESIKAGSDEKNYVPRTITTDTRMQVWLQEPVKAAGGQVKFIVAFSFEIPEYGTDRMGRLKTKNGWVYEVAQWYPRMAVYDDIQGWNTLPYMGAGEFYLEFGDVTFSITAPANLVIAGSGELVNEKEVLTPVQQTRLAEARNSYNTVMLRTSAE